ncbi:MAG TPA: PEP-CTERM sorting domain-containing protein [Telluria sp.]|jgi:hypothetical protein
MNLFRLTAALLLTAATALSAHAATYNYNGNEFGHDYINPTPSRMVASFTFDIADDFSGLLGGMPWMEQPPLAWSASAGALSIDSNTPGAALSYRFSFEKGVMTGWYFDLTTKDNTLQSLSENYIFFGPNMAHDIALIGSPATQSAAIYGNQGTWTISAVPEPETYLMLGAGLAVLAVARRKQKQSIAKQ